MFTRFSSLLTVTALAAVVAAAPGGASATLSCASGTNYCCNSTQDPTATAVTELAGPLGANLNGVAAPVGLTCTPILGSNPCTEQNVCCTGNNFNGELVLGCTPINAGV